MSRLLFTNTAPRAGGHIAAVQHQPSPSPHQHPVPLFIGFDFKIKLIVTVILSIWFKDGLFEVN